MPALLVYNLLLIVLFPLIYGFLLWRLAKGKEDGAHWGERWGRLPETVTGDSRTPRFWVHAVSVGELMAAVPLLREIRRRWPDALLLVSTITPSGREVAVKQMPPADSVVYFPLDFPLVVNRALKVARPDVVILMEWEIWPNFLAAAKRRGAKVVVVNGRVSDRGLRRGQRSRFWTAPGLAAVDRFAMQSEEDARRAALVGAEKERIVTLGNTKFDEAVTPVSDSDRAALRESLGLPPNAPIWVCGSTRPGEEALIARAYKNLREQFPDLRLIVAPRHIERAVEVAAVFAEAGLATVRRSEKALTPQPPLPQEGEGGRGGGGQAAVLLLDTFGELGRVYAIAEVAFVGGSLLPFGGQSVFQPLAQGVPAVFGPYMNNQRDIAALSKTEGVGFEVAADADALTTGVGRLLARTPEAKTQMAAQARGLIERNQGVAARCVDLIAELLG